MCAALGVDPLAAAVEGAKAKARAGERVSVGDGVVEEVGAREGGKEKGIGGLKGLLWDRMGKGFGKSGSVRYVKLMISFSCNCHGHFYDFCLLRWMNTNRSIYLDEK